MTTLLWPNKFVMVQGRKDTPSKRQSVCLNGKTPKGLNPSHKKKSSYNSRLNLRVRLDWLLERFTGRADTLLVNSFVGVNNKKKCPDNLTQHNITILSWSLSRSLLMLKAPKATHCHFDNGLYFYLCILSLNILKVL